MAAIINTSFLPWNDGEKRMQAVLPGPRKEENPTHVGLTNPAWLMLQRAPLIAVGAIDAEGRPWSSIWGGEKGFCERLNGPFIGFKTTVDRKHDPVVNALFDGKTNGEVTHGSGTGKMFAALPIDLPKGDRQKVYGRFVAGTVEPLEANEDVGALQMAIRFDQSLGNCPKYLNGKITHNVEPSPKLVSDGPDLPQEALDIIAEADMFFISTANFEQDMDTNNRGGQAGFVRPHHVKAADSQTGEAYWELVYPEYSGNGYYSTLGNMVLNPVAGLVIPSYTTGNVLYVTARAEVLTGADANALIPRSMAAVRLRVVRAITVLEGLPFRGESGMMSPYNPKVRKLVVEAGDGDDGIDQGEIQDKVQIVKQEQLTPSISRFVLKLDPDRRGTIKKRKWKAGQWVALDFSKELGHGWEHMMEDDPKALNDDYVRTFTVSSPPPDNSEGTGEFEITIRRVGNVTRWMFQQRGRMEVDVALRGFGGNVAIEQKGDLPTGFVAAGIGITPILGQLKSVEMEKLKLFWTLRLEDIDLVEDILQRHPQLARSTALFLTGLEKSMIEQKQKVVDAIKAKGITIEQRRLQKEDLGVERSADKWYCCVAPPLQETLSGWLAGKDVIYEDFF